MNELDYLAAVVRDAFARLGRGMAGKVRAINDAIEEQRVLDSDAPKLWGDGAFPQRAESEEPSTNSYSLLDDQNWWSDPSYSGLEGNYYHSDPML